MFINITESIEVKNLMVLFGRNAHIYVESGPEVNYWKSETIFVILHMYTTTVDLK